MNYTIISPFTATSKRLPKWGELHSPLTASIPKTNLTIEGWSSNVLIELNQQP